MWHLETASDVQLSAPSAAQQDAAFYCSIQKTDGGKKDAVGEAACAITFYKSVFVRLLK